VTSDVIRSFNRDTAWLATGVLSALFFAVLFIAIEEWQTNAMQAEHDLLQNVNSAMVGSVVARSSNSNRQIPPGSGSIIDHALTETPLEEIPSSRMEPATSAPVPEFIPEKNRNAQKKDSARLGEPKTRNLRSRSSVAFGYIGVKRRLIELWHESLAKSEKPRSWTAFSNLNSGTRKKAAYTAEMNR
jgi:hypothetical protein